VKYQALPVVQVLRAAVTALAITLAGAVGIFFWVALGQAGQYYAAPVAMGVAVISLLAGGIRAGLEAPRKGWLHGAITGNLYALVMSWVASLWFPSFGLGDGLTWLLYSMALGAVGGSAGINLREKRLFRAKRPGLNSYRYYS